MALFAEGFVKYPEDLPCPQVDTDIKPRERRYISDIGEVKKLRRFQSTFQAERQKISFIFTRPQAEEFRRWYREDIIEGGAWFYADWPILHKDKRIAYRFITRPVWEFLPRNVYHVTASVETYERRVGRAANIYTSKIYPYYFNDAIMLRGVSVRASPFVSWRDAVQLGGKRVAEGSLEAYIYSNCAMRDEAVILEGKRVVGGYTDNAIYSGASMQNDAIMLDGTRILSGATNDYGYIGYSVFSDAIARSGVTILSGEIE